MSGSSLSDVAAKQGVSKDDLLKQIESDLKNRPQRPDDTSGTSATGGASGLAPTTATACAVSAQLDAGSGVSVLL